jgi:hypothetical protein
MPKFVIEREIPGASGLDWKPIAQKSNEVIKDELGSEIQWVESFVTGDKVYCVYRAPSEDLLRKHAELGGFPINKVSQVTSMIDPTTAE